MPNESDWLKHKLQVNDEEDDEKLVLAKDANLKNNADWIDIHDPRNPLNQKRRELDAGNLGQKKKSKRS